MGRPVRHVSVVVATVLAAGAAGPVSVAAAGATAEKNMITEINRVRADHGGLDALRPAPQLGRSALRFSRWLLRHDLFAHSPASSRHRSSRRSGEALAMHYSPRPDVRGTVRSWLRSPAHRGLVLTTSMNVAGVGHASGRFGRRKATIRVLEVARG